MISCIGVWDAEYAGSEGRRVKNTLVAEAYISDSRERKSLWRTLVRLGEESVVEGGASRGITDAEQVSLRSVRSTITVTL